MSTKLLVLSIAGAVSIGAAAGGYAALRSNSATPPPVASPAPMAPTDTTATVDPAPLPEAATPAPTPAAAPTSASRLSEPGPARSAERARVPARVPASSRGTSAASEPSAHAPAPAPVAPPTADPPVSDPKDFKSDPPAPRSPDRPKPVFEDLTVNQDSVIGIRLDSAVSSETAKVEDKVSATVARDVTVGDRTAIPSGAKLEGAVAVVDRGGKFKDRARLGIRFHSIVLADGTRMPIQTETIFRDGESPTGPAASKVGASAAVGGILGAVIGGKKGAAIGTTVGAAGGAAAVMAGGPKDAVLQAGTLLTLRLTSPVTVTIEREQGN